MLNGHFVSRGPDLVSSLTWGSLLSFFASREHPVGASELDPVVVQGKPPLAAVEDHLLSKRRVSLEDDEHPAKRNRTNEGNLGFKGVQDNYFDADGIHRVKRELKLEDDCSSKKRRLADCSSGLMHEPPKSPTVFQKLRSSLSSACLIGHGKRLMQQDEFVPAFLSCKRVR